MSDNVAITPGIGATIKTRNVGGTHVQAVDPEPAATVAVTKVTVGTASTAIIAANADRRVAIIQIVSGGPVYVSSGAATLDGFPLAAGGIYEHQNTSALNGIVASGSADVRILEEA